VHVEDAKPNKSRVVVCDELEVVVVAGPKEISVVLKQFVSFKGATAAGREKMMSTHYEPTPLVSFPLLLATYFPGSLSCPARA
jgi:hypothetical protein